MFLCKSTITLTAEQRGDGHFLRHGVSIYQQVIVSDNLWIGTLEFIISCPFHFPCVGEEIIRENALAGFILNVIDPYRFTILIKIKFSKRVQITCDMRRIFVGSVINAIEIMCFGIRHQFDFRIQRCFADCSNCDWDFFPYADTIAGKGNN